MNVARRLGLALYTLIGLVAGIDAGTVKEHLAGKTPERLAAGVLIGLGALFLLRGIGAIAGAAYGGDALPRTELAVLVADFLTIPAWIIGGGLLWRRQAAARCLRRRGCVLAVNGSQGVLKEP